MVKTLAAFMFLALFVCGVWSVLENNLVGAVFFGVAWAGETIAISIDHWPRIKIWEHLKKMAKEIAEDSPND